MKMANSFKMSSHYKFDSIIEFVIQITCFQYIHPFLTVSYMHTSFSLLTPANHSYCPTSSVILCFPLQMSGLHSCIFFLVLARTICVPMSLKTSTPACEQQWKKKKKKRRKNFSLLQNLSMANKSRKK